MNDTRRYTVCEKPDVYYQGTYWNSYEYVRQQLNLRISGHAEKPWHTHFKEQLGGRRLSKALILCCGNGWLERELLHHGLFDEAVGIDYSETLLEKARSDARGLPVRYYQMDVNCATFPDERYDLVVNHAAAHHIAYIDRVFREIARLLPEDGYFLTYDYVGAHRNQYPAAQWKAARRLNEKLPPHLRQEMRYPHLPTMIHVDPTEAVHSELIVPMLNRYFKIEEHKHLGGALAYLLLTHNDNMRDATRAEQDRWVEYIMDADWEYLQTQPESSLFDYIVARPDKAILNEGPQLAEWTKAELQRESIAQQTSGRYDNTRKSSIARKLTDMMTRAGWGGKR